MSEQLLRLRQSRETSEATQVINFLRIFVDFCGIDISRWYVGITNDWERRQREHKVKDYSRAYQTKTEGVARLVERFLIEMGMQGGDGGGTGEDDAVWVYVYLIQRHTVE